MKILFVILYNIIIFITKNCHLKKNNIQNIFDILDMTFFFTDLNDLVFDVIFPHTCAPLIFLNFLLMVH